MRHWKTICIACAWLAATVIASPAQTFTTLVNFNGANGSGPGYVSLAQGTDGSLYGTTEGGGQGGWGTVFKMTPSGTLTTIYSFAEQNGTFPNGATPWAGLVLGTDGNFYGTTIQGGSSTSCSGGCGTVFKVTPTGTLTTLYSFASVDGTNPSGGLIQGTDGNLYGTTQLGGANSCDNGGLTGCGTIFKITPGGRLTTLHSFNGTDGWKPIGGLVQGSDGNFYGTTVQGGFYGGGAVFRMTPAGVLSTMYSFCAQSSCSDGEGPFAALIQAPNGNFYGTTSEGGASNCAFGVQGGTVFKITSRGVLTTLSSICTGPEAPLTRPTDGNLYGTTREGGGGSNCTAAFSDGCGTLFKIIPRGAPSTLHAFNATDGEIVLGGLLQATNGKLYGTTWEGGTGIVGTVFSEDIGLDPFITFVLPRGKVGKTAQILGQGLTGTTAVTFNAVPATSFSVVSDTYMTAVVPTGATTGPVVVTTPSETLTSNKNFQIVQ